MRSEKIKRVLRAALPAAATVLVLLFALCVATHNLQLRREAELIEPLGIRVTVNGRAMRVYTEGSGPYTLLFLSGGGTCSPILDFKSLYSLLSENFRIVVVERAGYGFSDDAGVARDVDTILEETRKALSQACIGGPFVLCPHSMSGLEALYWTQKYPEEVAAIVGLDMAVPAAYEEMEINIPLMKLGSLANKLGLTRWIPGLCEGDAIKGGTLTEEEKELYRALFYRRTLTEAMLNEAEAVKDNAALVAAGERVEVPMLLFASDGSGGTGYDKETWRGFQTDFAAHYPEARVVELDCPHYVHDYAYGEIAEKTADFLAGLGENREEG